MSKIAKIWQTSKITKKNDDKCLKYSNVRLKLLHHNPNGKLPKHVKLKGKV